MNSFLTTKPSLTVVVVLDDTSKLVTSSRRCFSSLEFLVPPALTCWSGRFLLYRRRRLTVRVQRRLLFPDVADRPLRPRFGIVDGLVGLALVGGKLRRDADLEIIDAEIGRQRLADVLLTIAPTIFCRLAILVGAAVASSSSASSKVPSASSTVTLSRVIPGMAAVTRCRIDCAVRASSAPSLRSTTDAEGGCWVARERATHGQHDVNPCRLHALHQLDGARDLAFKRAKLGDLLHERGQPQRADLVEQFIAGIRAGRQPLLREQHPRLHRSGSGGPKRRLRPR